MYQFLFNQFFRKLDPELAHALGAIIIRLAAWFPSRQSATVVEVAGLRFHNRIGMAAGFDKNAKLVRGLFNLGFGHVEIGTVTPRPQSGNEKPRLFRLVSLRALINRMGFNNDGVEVIAKRLKRLRSRPGALPVIGVNIGKNKATSAERAVDDYEYCAKELAPFSDYLAVNVSSPNTPGLRDLQQVESLRPILQAVSKNAAGKPVFVKISPDLSDGDALSIAQLLNELNLAGVISCNTTLSRPESKEKYLLEQGGLSGAPLAQRSKDLLTLFRSALPNKAIISVGGIESARDVRERIELGADLVQGYTGFVYFGPSWPRMLTKDA